MDDLFAAHAPAQESVVTAGMPSTTIHIHIPIAALLAMPDEELAGTLSPGSGPELRAMLVCMKAAGKTALTGKDCDRQDAEGRCLGHRRN